MPLIQPLPKHASAAFELKGRMMTLSVLRVLTSDLDALCQQLDAKIATAPDFFQNFPVLLDFEELSEESQCGFDIARMNRLLRERSFVPVGLRAASDVLIGIAAGVGIGVISGSAAPERDRRERAKDKEASAKPTANLLVRQPVRSGQQVYAEGGDLIVLTTVSPGAEILADGNIHIYGALRGRALAGVRGNTDARIFCRSLDAELISIAGNYRVSEKIQESEREQPVQIYLNGDNLVIENL
ncbi:MAG: septum site-determining protein MinC [Gammaproteobacteria bacterium]|nr:septum site-determining protein MinC [Gammaproteobacteria bacterium]